MKWVKINILYTGAAGKHIANQRDVITVVDVAAHF